MVNRSLCYLTAGSFIASFALFYFWKSYTLPGPILTHTAALLCGLSFLLGIAFSFSIGSIYILRTTDNAFGAVVLYIPLALVLMFVACFAGLAANFAGQ